MSWTSEYKVHEANNQNSDDISVYIEDREYIANKYVMKCFFVTMVCYVISFILNILEIFVVNKVVMANGFFSVIDYISYYIWDDEEGVPVQ